MIQSRLENTKNDVNPQSAKAFSKLSFIVKKASEYEKNKIMKIMASEYRQTMNLRLMPTAQLILLQDESKNNETVGWIGVDYQFNPIFPETFSLFIMPNYRSYHLSFALKHAVYSILNAQGISKAYARMEASHNQKLIQYNIDAGFYRILYSSEINSTWQAMCLQCELYGKNCKSQIYLEVDVSKIVTSLNNKLGRLPNVNFPKSINLISTTHIKNQKQADLLLPKWSF